MKDLMFLYIYLEKKNLFDVKNYSITIISLIHILIVNIFDDVFLNSIVFIIPT